MMAKRRSVSKWIQVEEHWKAMSSVVLGNVIKSAQKIWSKLEIQEKHAKQNISSAQFKVTSFH
jgi:phage-related tail protein